jgi:hypothetical protein
LICVKEEAFICGEKFGMNMYLLFTKRSMVRTKPFWNCFSD